MATNEIEGIIALPHGNIEQLVVQWYGRCCRSSYHQLKRQYFEARIEIRKRYAITNGEINHSYCRRLKCFVAEIAAFKCCRSFS